MPRYKFLTTVLYRNRRKYIKIELGRKVFSTSTANIFDTLTGIEKIIQRKINEYSKWYDNLSGLTEVKMCQDRVIKAQEKLISIQEKHKWTNNELLYINGKLNDLHKQLLKMNKDDPNYLSLVCQEHEIIQEEKKMKTISKNEEKEERDSFLYLSTAITDSHEKQTLHANRLKYWMFFFAVLGPLISYLLNVKKDKIMVRDMVANINKNSNFASFYPILKNIEKEFKIKNLTTEEIKTSWAWSSYTWCAIGGILLCFLYASSKH